MLDRTAGAEQPNHANPPPSPWTDEKIERLKEMRDSGQSYGAISTELGFTRSAIAGKVRRLGLDKRERAPKRSDGGALARRPRGKSGANKDRAATQRIAKTLKVRSPSNGGAVVIESVVREEAPPRANFLGIALMDLESEHCRFPRGEGTSILFCGQKTISGESWCRDCYRIIFQAPRPYLPTGGSKPAVV